ncbi:PAS domain S-box protein [candidate division KSB1 bacterium]|nr:PAS domain S-box protein [candidate division KSB1 bacterium]
MIGQINENVMDVLLESVPFEFSLVDHNDKVLAWNKHDSRLFKRPKGVLGKDVRDCHPQKSLDQVERIIAEMKSGERNKARFWIDMNIDGKEKPQKILIEYYALRDGQENYLGCLEVSQNITDLQQLSGEKRLMD